MWVTSMIRHSPLTCDRNTTLRFYTAKTSDPYAPYVGVATVGWESPTVIWIEAMHGNLTWQHWNELTAWFVGMGIVTIKAHRSPDRDLPFARVVGDHMEIEVSRLARRFGKSTPMACAN